MGEHSKPSWTSRLSDAGRWLAENRRKVYAVAVVALPLVSRYVPGFPSEEILSVARVILGV